MAIRHPQLVRKLVVVGQAMTREGWFPEPVMLVFADADAVSTRHIAEFYKALGGGVRDAGLDGTKRPKARLAIIPGATHYNIMDTTVVAEAVEPFLAAK